MAAVMERFYDNGMLDFLVKEREAGRIRNLGWSFHGEIEVFDYLLSQMDEGKIHWDFVQIQMNYMDWKHASGWNTNAEYLLGELEKRNIPAAVMEPLLGGQLSRLSSESFNIIKQLRPEDSPASWAFRFAGSFKNILTVLSGMVYMEHLQENIRTFSPLEPLNEQEYEALEKVTEIMLNGDYVACSECEYCMPCPYGIDIPGVFGHYNRIISAGKRLKSSKDENYKAARQAFLIGYDRNVPKLRQANHCIGCEICKPLCTQTIDIPSEMRRIDLYAEQLKQKMEF
jgi:predicted aldo/keto reductase-like oxidoreductase